MTAPNDVRVGDNVRVTFTHEGIAAKDQYGIYVPSSTIVGGRVYLDDSIHPTIEVLERAVPKVGDVVKGTDLDRLPNFSIVMGSENKRAYQKIGAWNNGFHGRGNYRVLYVPEDGAR